jgi:hypothetical protein
MVNIEGVDRDNMSEGEISYQQPFRVCATNWLKGNVT